MENKIHLLLTNTIYPPKEEKDILLDLGYFDSSEDAIKVMHENKEKAGVKEIFYTRGLLFEDDKTITYDVGSYTKFFALVFPTVEMLKEKFYGKEGS